MGFDLRFAVPKEARGANMQASLIPVFFSVNE
jgi:hypothetical protein